METRNMDYFLKMLYHFFLFSGRNSLFVVVFTETYFSSRHPCNSAVQELGKCWNVDGPSKTHKWNHFDATTQIHIDVAVPCLPSCGLQQSNETPGASRESRRVLTILRAVTEGGPRKYQIRVGPLTNGNTLRTTVFFHRGCLFRNRNMLTELRRRRIKMTHCVLNLYISNLIESFMFGRSACESAFSNETETHLLLRNTNGNHLQQIRIRFQEGRISKLMQ